MVVHQRKLIDLEVESVVERGSIPLSSTKRRLAPDAYGLMEFRFSFNGADRLRHGVSKRKKTTRGQPALVEDKSISANDSEFRVAA